jgi:hypothetical protein
LKVKRTFYIQEESLEKLKIMSEKLDISLNSCIEKAIDEFVIEDKPKKIQKKIKKYGEGGISDNIR